MLYACIYYVTQFESGRRFVDLVSRNDEYLRAHLQCRIYTYRCIYIFIYDYITQFVPENRFMDFFCRIDACLLADQHVKYIYLYIYIRI